MRKMRRHAKAKQAHLVPRKERDRGRGESAAKLLRRSLRRIDLIGAERAAKADSVVAARARGRVAGLCLKFVMIIPNQFVQRRNVGRPEHGARAGASFLVVSVEFGRLVIVFIRSIVHLHAAAAAVAATISTRVVFRLLAARLEQGQEHLIHLAIECGALYSDRRLNEARRHEWRALRARARGALKENLQRHQGLDGKIATVGSGGRGQRSRRGSERRRLLRWKRGRRRRQRRRRGGLVGDRGGGGGGGRHFKLKHVQILAKRQHV
jgi:hypothetical protein